MHTCAHTCTCIRHTFTHAHAFTTHVHTDDDDDDDVVMSGWGDVEGMREDLLKDWGDILERWNGKDRTRPSRVIKLCRKV